MPAIYLRSAPLASPLLALAAIALTVAVSVLLPVEVVTHVMREGGPIENATAILYVVAAGAVFLVRHPAFGGLAKSASAFVLACCIAREVSVRRWLLDAPSDAYCCTAGQTRVVIGVLLVMLIAAGVWLALRYTRALYTALMQCAPAAVSLVTMFTCAALSQVFDRLPRITPALFGYTASMRGRALALSLEEVLEMMLPALVILAVLQARRAMRPQAVSPDARARA